MAIPSRVAERLAAGLKRFQPVLQSARNRDVNESDTSMIVTDMLADVFGYDKYNEITREHCIRGTYCDLATKIDGKVQILIEVKAIGVELKDAHVKQAVDYAANLGVEWVAVTNGPVWKIFKVVFGKPIDQELVLDVNIFELNPRTQAHLESLYLLTRESVVRSALSEYHDFKQATSRFFLAAVLTSDSVLEVVRRDLRRVSNDVKITIDELRDALSREVLKREVIEGEKADQARKKVARAAKNVLRLKKDRADDSSAKASAAPRVDVNSTEPLV